MSTKKKVLWLSNAPYAPTGYGRQTALAVSTLSKEFDIGVATNYGLQGQTLNLSENIKLYPGEGNPYDGSLLWAIRDFTPDVIITFYDPWAMEWMKDAEAKGIPWISWFPVDAAPASSLSVDKLATASEVWACSQFGVDTLKKYSGVESLYMPCGEDFDHMFTPLDVSREDLFAGIGFPTDGIVFGMVGNNKGVPNRKGFVEALDAFSKFLQTGRSGYLYLHTILGQQRKGIDIPAMVEYFEIPDDRVYWVDQTRYHLGQIKPHELVAMYNAIDVLLQPSYAEGFGIPIIEAQGCGTPVIGANNTTMPELISRAGGWLVESQNFPHPHSALYGLPITTSILDRMIKAYSEFTSSGLADRGRVAREFTHANYNWKDISEKMVERISEVIDGRAVSPK